VPWISEWQIVRLNSINDMNVHTNPMIGRVMAIGSELVFKCPKCVNKNPMIGKSLMIGSKRCSNFKCAIGSLLRKLLS
jgi:hypothetical protein